MADRDPEVDGDRAAGDRTAWVSRVAAGAVGLAHAARDTQAAVRELSDLAAADGTVLVAARQRLAVLEHLDERTRQRADVLLQHAHRRVVHRGAAPKVHGSSMHAP